MPLKSRWTQWIQTILGAAVVIMTATGVNASDRHALLIGYNDYTMENGLQPLQFAAKDVSDLRTTLIEMGYQAEDITVLNAKNGNSSPTAATIRSELEKLKNAAANEPGGSVMIVFAGHGFNHEGESYLCPADYRKDHPTESAIAVHDITRVLAEAEADGRYLIIDACRNEFVSTGEAEFNLGTGLKKLRISSRDDAQGTVVLSSCMPGQQSWEVDRPAVDRKGSALPHQNGVFMHYIMQGLRGAADVFDQQTGFDGAITATELHEYAARETLRFVNAEQDTAQRPWADMHTTANLAIVTLNEQQKKKLGSVQRRSAESLLDQEVAEQKTGDGVMLLVGGDRELRPLATVRFSQAIELSPELYMPRRLRALLSVLEGNNNKAESSALYRNALADMQAVGSSLRVAVPYDSEQIDVFGPSTSVNGKSEYASVAMINAGDVIEVDDISDANGVTWLKVRRINRWLVDESAGTGQETIEGYIQLAQVARPEADKAQLQDINRLRKPTVDELRLMNRTKPVAMRSPGLENAANALQIAGEVNALAGSNPGVAKGLGYAGAGIGLANDIQKMKAEKQQTGRVSIGTVRNAVGRFGIGF